MGNVSDRGQLAAKVTKIGIVWNVFLTVIKFFAGILGHSSALVADAIHSLSDFVSDIAVLAGLRIANKPKDDNHHYGHGKFETLTTLAITLTLFFAGTLMLYESGQSIYKMSLGQYPPIPKSITLWTALLSIVIKEGLYRYTLRTGKSINSQALITNAWHHRTDALSSIAVSVGIAGSIFLGAKWRLLDPAAAFFISIFILHFAFGIFKAAIYELTEASLDKEINDEILQTAASIPGTINPHNMKTRKIGSNYAIEMHISVDAGLSIVEAHDIASDVENKLKERYGAETFVSIHIEPYEQEKISADQSK